MIKFFMHDKEIKKPERGTPQSSGIDFFSPTDVLIQPGEDALIDLQVSVLIPDGYELQMCNKSGVSTKLKLLKGAEIVDNDYLFPNKIHAHLFNFGKMPVFIKRNQKIIQGVIRKVEIWDIAFEEDPDNMKKESLRVSGFGSTGT